MSFWKVDLTTRVGALGATHLGSMGCFACAALSAFSLFMVVGIVGSASLTAQIALTVVATQIAISLIAGFRMRQGKGAFWGMAVLALIGIDVASKIANFSIVGLVISGVLAVCVIQGVRGALALRGETRFEDDDAEVFE